MTATPAELVSVADAIVAELANLVSEHVGEIEPVRSYADWAEELKDLGDFRVDVVPVGYPEEEADSRGSIGYRCAVDVGVRKKFAQADRESSGRIKLAEIDKLVGLVQEIHTFLFNRRLSTYEGAAFREVKFRVVCSRKHLRDDGLFLGVVRVFYDVSAEVEDD